MDGSYIRKLIDENYTTKRVIISNPDSYVKKCYHLGIIDGYMLEDLYKDMIKKEECIISYEKGYKKGNSLRNSGTTKELRANKKYFIERLAFYDALNSITSNVSDNALEMYNDYYEGGYNFKTGKYTPKSKK